MEDSIPVLLALGRKRGTVNRVTFMLAKADAYLRIFLGMNLGPFLP